MGFVRKLYDCIASDDFNVLRALPVSTNSVTPVLAIVNGILKAAIFLKKIFYDWPHIIIRGALFRVVEFSVEGF